MKEPHFFDSFDNFSNFISRLGQGIHAQAETNLSDILSRVKYSGHAIPEINCDGGRVDLIFFLPIQKKTLHFEIFISRGQVIQDLRLLEQSKFDKKIAVVLDPEIEPTVISHYFHKSPSNQFELFLLSDFFLETKIDSTINRIESIIKELIQTDNNKQERIQKLLNSIVKDYHTNYGFDDPLKAMKSTKKIAELLERDIDVLTINQLIDDYEESVSYEKKYQKESGSSITLFLGSKSTHKLHSRFIQYFNEFYTSLKYKSKSEANSE